MCILFVLCIWPAFCHAIIKRILIDWLIDWSESRYVTVSDGVSRHVSRLETSQDTLHVSCLGSVLTHSCLVLIWLESRSSMSRLGSVSWRCASGCVVECRICNQEVAGSHLGRGYFAPRSTQPSIPTGSVNEYQLRLGRQRQVWLIPIGGVQVRLWNPLRKLTIPERFCGAWWFTTKRRYTKCRPMHLLFGFSLEKSLC